ncbi:MAG: redoxin domain-containing protein [Clostridia bacterium]|nr:redoxin domain-containing protein [Clostridia bacterium]
MKKTHSIFSFLSLLIAATLLLSVLGGCGKEPEPCDFTVWVKSEGGAPLKGVDVHIYTDETRTDLVWVGHTDADGKTVFEGKKGNTYTAFLEEVPAGYTVDERYSVAGEQTEIILSIQLLSEDLLNENFFRTGNVAVDFSFTDTDGNTHRLSELLETKKAVILNFWFLNCDPCRMEFPYMQEAYEEYKDRIEVIAVNPMDGNNESIASYAEELGLTFPMVKGSSEWQEAMGLNGYPTTVVIDRYGTVGMVHSHAFTGAEDFIKVFDFFTSDNYVQTTVRNLSQINDIK